MAPRRRVRRTSSLPGLASDDPTGLSVAVAATPPVVLPPTPSAAPPSYSFTFTTNLTPNTFQHADKSSAPKDKATPTGGISDLYPPQEGVPSPANSTSSNSRKRTADALDEFYTDALPPRSTPHTRKFSVGHIPRPPNAFILFRSDLVARKAVPTSLEADHSTISKIIGVCWRTLPARQRKRWEQKALEAKAAHKKQYPDYRYTPVHRKGPSRKKAKKEQKKDDARVDELAQLLLSGSKGAELEERVKKLDESNPDSYQSTLSFNNGAGGPMDSHGQQFTFVQGFPAAGHSIQVPSAPNMYAHHHYNPNQPRRHSSAPPADNAFLDGGASSSTASTPRTTSRDLSLHTNDGADSTSPTDSLVPLSRIARKLPTKSTHHLQPHHFRDEANINAANAAHAAHASATAAANKKLKSSMSKAVRARAQGFGAPQPASERDQLFIQSHWTNASIDPSSTAGEMGKKKKSKRQAIPQDMLMAPWDLKEGTTQSGNASPNITSHAVPLPNVPGFISADHYSPSYAPAYPDEKYQYDGAGVGPFDLLTYQDYGLTGLDMDPLSSGDLSNSAALNAALNGTGALSGFDFADQFGALGVEADANDDYGYSYYAQGAELGSGPASANSSSPHNSDADEAAAYHPYDMPAPLTMAAQDPLGGYSSAQHPIVYNAPDWNAFNGTTTTSAAQPAELDPLDPLSAPPSTTTAGPGTGTGGFDHFVYPPLPNSGPPSECGDADEYGDYSHSPIRQTMPMSAPAPAFSMRQQHQPMQLSLNMQYVTPSSAPGSAASYDYSHVHTLDYAHHQAQQYSPAASSATSPVIYQHVHHSAHPHSAQVQVMMAPPSHHIQQSPHLQQHHPHHALPHSHMHSHSHSHSMESFHELHEPMIQSGGEQQQQQWGEWTHPDPFRQQGGDESHAAVGGFDPLATGSSAIVDAYRG